MKSKFGIRKTKMNIFWLFLIGLLIGVVLGLRQPASEQDTSKTEITQINQTQENLS